MNLPLKLNSHARTMHYTTCTLEWIHKKIFTNRIAAQSTIPFVKSPVYNNLKSQFVGTISWRNKHFLKIGNIQIKYKYMPFKR